MRYQKHNTILQTLIRTGVYLLCIGLIFGFHGEITNWLYGYKVGVLNIWPVLIIYPLFFALLFLRRKKIETMTPYKNGMFQTMLFGALALYFFFKPNKEIFIGTANLIFTVYLPLYIGTVLLLFAVFNMRFVRLFKREIFLFILAMAGYLVLNIIIENNWQFYSKIIIGGLNLALPLLARDPVHIQGNFHLTLKDFSVFVGPTCTGIYSMLAFGILFWFAVLLARKKYKLKKTDTGAAFLLGMIALFVLNIVRIAIIVYVGAYVSEKLALTLFHEYLSAIFLVAVFSLYLYVVMPRLVVLKSVESRLSLTLR